MRDPFVGTWTLNPARSEFDPNHRPSQATLRWEPDAGGYVMLASGTDAGGRPCEERQRFRLDGVAHPVEGLSGLTSVTTRPERNTIRAEVRREDGSLAGEGTYVVDDEGRSMIATISGFDSQLRAFTQRTAWDRS